MSGSILQSLSREGRAREGVSKVPGELGLWGFLFCDLSIFTTLFGVWMYYRSQDIVGFTQSQATLSETYATLNTILLLLSSWCVVMALKWTRSQDLDRAKAMIIAAMSCGVGFSVVKIIEYADKAKSGITIVTNEFYTLYFMATGMHFLHVIIGLGVLSLMYIKLSKTHINEADYDSMENGATYWHMVDLLWIILFPLIYLMG